MAKKKNKDVNTTALKTVASDLLKESIGYLKDLKYSEGNIKYFPGGIELIEIGVEFGSAKVNFKVSGHEPNKKEEGA